MLQVRLLGVPIARWAPLFDLRDDAVHHEEAFRQMVVTALYEYPAERADLGGACYRGARHLH